MVPWRYCLFGALALIFPLSLSGLTVMVFGAAGLLFGLAGGGLVTRLGSCWGLLDRPGPRSSHQVSTPKGGGIGLLFAFFFGAFCSGFPAFLWLPAVVLSLVSMLGDRVEIPPWIRLIVQFAVTGLAVSWIFLHCAETSGLFQPFTALLLLCAAVFVAGTANVYNFMDGIDGLAGITGVLAFGLLAFTGGVRGENPSWVVLAMTLSAGCAGFLPWNFPRARVFMGDVGSVLLGFVFALYVVAWSRTLADFLLFISFLLPFYLDEAVTLLPRLREGDSLTRPHRRHVYQILVNQMVIPHWRISLLYGTVQLVVALVTLFLRPWGWPGEAVWLLAACGAGAGLASWVRRRER